MIQDKTRFKRALCSITILALGISSCGEPSTEPTPEPTGPGLLVSELSTADGLGDHQRQFTVQLDTAPTADVTITLSSSNADVEVSLIPLVLQQVTMQQHRKSQ